MSCCKDIAPVLDKKEEKSKRLNEEGCPWIVRFHFGDPDLYAMQMSLRTNNIQRETEP